MTVDAPILCWRTTRAIAFSEAWPIDNAQNQLQVLCGRRSLPTPHVFDDSSAAKGAASVSRLVLDTSVHFLRFKDFFAVAKGNMYTLADRVRVVTLKGEYVGQEGFYARIGHGRRRSPLSRNRLYACQLW
jgi:hypothetical protein